MADRPSEFPEWASAPPGGSITSPSTPERQAGDQPAGAPVGAGPRRQFHNWLFNLIYRWQLWFHQAIWRASDLFVNQALLVGSAPVTGAGLTVVANSFSGRVIADGYSVGPDAISGPAYTYSATSDTYWDLGRDGAWHPVVVAALAAEPAVTAQATRVYMVRTNATDRTAVFDYRRSRVKVVPIEIGVAGTQIDENNSRMLVRYNGDGTGAFGSDPHYTPITEVRPLANATNRTTFRVYANSHGVMFLVFGAVWDSGALQWSIDGSGSSVVRWRIDGNLVTAEAPSGGGPWADASWAAANVSVSMNTRVDMLSQIRWIMGAGRQKILDFDSVDGNLGIYLSLDGTASFGPCLEFVRNARWNAGGSQWERVSAGIVTKLDVRPGAMRRLEHAGALAANFADTINPGSTWSFPLRYAVFQGASFQVGNSPSSPGYNGFNPTAGLIAPGSTGGAATASFYSLNAADAFLPINAGDIPDGAIIASAALVVSSPVGNGVLQAAVVRIPTPWTSGGVIQALKVSNTYDTIPEINGTVQTVALTLDASEATRTVDRTNYAYGIPVHKTHTDAAVDIYEARIGYYVPNAIQ